MHGDEHVRIRVAASADGTLTYLVDLAPEALPPVRRRDLVSAASRQAWGAARLFRFRRADGEWTDLALADRDACCWAAAVDDAMGMHTSYGLSVCLRLLALVDLLGRSRWAAPLFRVTGGGAELSPSLLREAAIAPLTREARFDETPFRALVTRRLATRPASPLASGACA
jgi:hypothetical protein